ncbi:MAG: ribonuclease III [Patescibacteria group bacterium]
MIDFSKFEKKADIVFKDRGLLEQAFTHRSYINENKNAKKGHNERLEFLGDAVLELIVTDFLYHKYTTGTEGDLTSYRAALVNAITLSKVAVGLSMNDYLLLSKGEAKDTGRARQFILANTMEAVIGAIYLDQGYQIAKAFLKKHLFPLIDDVVAKKLWMDAKSHFQEKAQDKTGQTPNYKTLKEVGPDHDKCFTVGVFIGTEQVGVGEGLSKQEAEQVAAADALEKRGWR